MHQFCATKFVMVDSPIALLPRLVFMWDDEQRLRSGIQPAKTLTKRKTENTRIKIPFVTIMRRMFLYFILKDEMG